MLTRFELEDIQNHFRNKVRENFPEIFYGLIDELYHREFRSRRDFILNDIRLVIDKLKMSERTNFDRTLNLLNEFIETENGERIQDIIVTLTPEEQEQYGRSHINLSENKLDYSKFIGCSSFWCLA